MTSVMFVVFCLVVGNNGIKSTEIETYEAEWRRSRNLCGPIALSYCLHRFGNAVTSAELARQIQVVPENGVIASDLIVLANKYGFKAYAVMAKSKDYLALPVPSILILDSRHCVVFEGVDGNGDIRIYEPSDGFCKTADQDRLSGRWTGEVIVFEKPALSWIGFLSWIVFVSCSVLIAAKIGIVLSGRVR